MLRHFSRDQNLSDDLRRGGGLALLVAALLGAGIGCAQAQNVSLDQFSVPAGDKGGKLTIAHVDVMGTNLTREEVAALFSPQTPKDQAGAILLKMRAQKFAIPLVTLEDADGRFNLRGIEATNVADGHIEHLGFAGGEGSGVTAKGGNAAITLGQLDIVEADFTVLFEALRGGDLIGRQIPARSLLWKGGEASFPDNDTPANAPGGNLFKMSMGPLAVDTVYQGKIPVHAFVDWKGMSIVPPPASKAGQALTAFGYPSIAFSLRATGAYDPAREIYTFEDISLQAPQAGTMSFKFALASVGVDFLTGNRAAKAAALAGARVQNLSLGYADDGLLGKAAAFVARQQNKTPEAVRREWSMLANQFIPLGLGGDPSSLRIAATVAKFINEGGALTLSAQARGEAPKIGDLKASGNLKALQNNYALEAVAAR
jgi:hypothetical protein